MKNLYLLPAEFWVAMGLMLVAFAVASTWVRKGTGVPLMAVLGTVVFWYVGDVVYNDYANVHLQKFAPAVLSAAWVQVGIFLLTLVVSIDPLHRWINGRYLQRQSHLRMMMKHGVQDAYLQSLVRWFLRFCLITWSILLLVAVVRVGSDVLYFVIPFLGRKAAPFARGRLGGGIADALMIFCQHFHTLAAAGFGIVAALSLHPRTRYLAIGGCLLTWPFFLLDRTRNKMIAICLPGVLAWVFIRLRGSNWLKIAVLFLAFLGADTWLRFVMAARGKGVSVASAVYDADLSSDTAKHGGLNMYEELCWTNQLIASGRYKITWGKRYLAELVNPVPRSLWPGKPMIGIDYALARGMAWNRGAAGVAATISTGLIGQGNVNFGTLLGPMCSAFLMALWVVFLARLDLTMERLGHLPLYALGLVLTFNLGRDITLLVIYPVVFGYGLVTFLQYTRGRQSSSTRGLAAMR